MKGRLEFSEILERLLAGKELSEEEMRLAEKLSDHDEITPGQKGAFYLAKQDGWELEQSLVDAPGVIERLVKSVPEDAYDFKPYTGHWSIKEVVGHLADNEMVNAIRVRYILTEEFPEMIGYDSDIWDRFFNIDDVETSLRRWKDTRFNLIRLIQGLSEKEWLRKGHLSYRGNETLRNLLGVLAGHDYRHTLQIKRIKVLLSQ